MAATAYPATKGMSTCHRRLIADAHRIKYYWMPHYLRSEISKHLGGLGINLVKLSRARDIEVLRSGERHQPVNETVNLSTERT